MEHIDPLAALIAAAVLWLIVLLPSLARANRARRRARRALPAPDFSRQPRVDTHSTPDRKVL